MGFDCLTNTAPTVRLGTSLLSINVQFELFYKRSAKNFSPIVFKDCSSGSGTLAFFLHLREENSLTTKFFPNVFI